MERKNTSYTTIIGDLTPKQIHYLRTLFPPVQNITPFSSVYPEHRLNSNNVAIRRMISSNDSVTFLHSHSFLVFVYCRQSDGYEYLIGTQKFRLHDGDLLCIPPETPHRPIATNNAVSTFVRDELFLRADFLCTFDSRLPKDFFKHLKNSYHFSVSEKLRIEIDHLFQHGVEENEANLFRRDDAIESYASLLVIYIIRAILDQKTSVSKANQPLLFNQVLTYLKNNLDQKLLLEEIAQIFSVSKSTLNREFQKYTGTSFYHALSQLRLTTAQQYIVAGATLENASIKVGYYNYTTFYRAFKKEYGISPQQFKKELGQ